MLFWYQESKNLKDDAWKLLFKSEKEIIAIFEKILVEGNSSGEFTVSDTYLMANNIMVICDMWAFKRYLLRKIYSFEIFVNVQTDYIVHQIKYAH